MSQSRLTKEGLERARQKGFQPGNPTLETTALPKAIDANLKRGQRTVDKYLPTIQHIRSELLASQIKPTLSAIADRMNDLGIRSPRGKSISINLVRRCQNSTI